MQVFRNCLITPRPKKPIVETLHEGPAQAKQPGGRTVSIHHLVISACQYAGLPLGEAHTQVVRSPSRVKGQHQWVVSGQAQRGAGPTCASGKEQC